MFRTLKVYKGAKNSYRSYPKRRSEHQIYQSKQKFPKKSMFISLKVKMSQKLVWWPPENNRTQVKFGKPYPERRSV
jgi:hypothetical protein